MREIVLLAAGTGTKMFPYDLVGSKTLRPVAGSPIMLHMVRALRAFTAAPIHIVTLRRYYGAVSTCFEGMSGVEIHGMERSEGSAESLLEGMAHLSGRDAMVLYGDTWVDPEDLRRLYQTQDIPAALCFPLGAERAMDWICAQVEGGLVRAIGAHHRGECMTHRLAAFVLPKGFTHRLELTPEYFPGMKVGEGAPMERYVEAALCAGLPAGLAAIEGEGRYFDVDKPWHLLELNEYLVHRLCGALTATTLEDGSAISPGAAVNGFVHLGRNSYLGERVRVDGNLIVGDDTVIDNGAIFTGDAVVGNRTRVANYCQIYSGCSIGNDCIVEHGAELTGGMLSDRVYLYHLCEFYGLAGTCTDLGAGTLCGTLRFDDNETIHRTKGRAEAVRSGFGSATFLGDYCRTGVGTLFMPGCRVGSYTVVGAGVLAQGTIPPRSCVLLKQKQVIKDWGEEKYGW